MTFKIRLFKFLRFLKVPIYNVANGFVIWEEWAESNLPFSASVTSLIVEAAASPSIDGLRATTTFIQVNNLLTKSQPQMDNCTFLKSEKKTVNFFDQNRWRVKWVLLNSKGCLLPVLILLKIGTCLKVYGSYLSPRGVWRIETQERINHRPVDDHS